MADRRAPIGHVATPSGAQEMKKRPVRVDGPPILQASGSRANATRPRALGAGLDLELDLLAAIEAIEVERRIEAAAMEEVLLGVVSGDEAEAALGDDLLDGSGGHMDLQHFPKWLGRL